MKTVTLTRNMRPWQKGENATLPDEMADKLIKNGEAENPQPFPPPDVAPENARKDSPAENTRPRRYFTRKRA